jgi:hypothetical protein
VGLGVAGNRDGGGQRKRSGGEGVPEPSQ